MTACLLLPLMMSACTRSQSTFVALREPATGELQADGKKQFPITLQAGQILLIEAPQQQFNFAVSVTTPDGHVVTVDSPGKRVATERLVYDVQEAGTYIVTVMGREHPQASGTYHVAFYELPRNLPAIDGYRSLSVAAQKSAFATAEQRTEAAGIYEQAVKEFAAAKQTQLEAEANYALAALEYDHFSDWAVAAEKAHRAAVLFKELKNDWRYARAIGLEAASLTERGKTRGHGVDGASDLDRAITLLDEAAAIHLARNDEFWLAKNDNDRGLNLLYRDQFEAAVDSFHSAADRYGRLNERPDELMALQDIATVEALRGNYRAAATKLERVLRELNQAANPSAYADVASNTAFALAQVGETSAALRRYSQALEIQETLRDNPGQARSRQGVANIYWRMGEPERALEMFLATMPLREAAKDHRGIVVTLVSIGNLYRELRQLRQAAEFHARALDYATRNGLPTTERMRVQIAMAGDKNAAGDYQGALSAANAAGELDVPANHPFKARALLERARANSGKGDLDAASADLQQVIAVQAENGAPFDESMARVLYADVLHRQRRNADSLVELDKAMAQLESLRLQAAGPELRAAFLSARHEAYGKRVAVLLEDSTKATPHDTVMEALLTAERSHARSLLDGLSSRNSRRRDGNADEAETSRLYEQLDGHQLRMQLLVGQGVAPTDGRMTGLKSEINLLRAKIDAASSDAEEASVATSFDNVSTRAELLDLQHRLLPGDVVLNYFLSSPRSWLWRITRDDIRVIALADKASIDKSAARFLAALRRPSTSMDEELRESGKALARQILSPVELPTAMRRTVVIPDGMLLHVPFNALPADDAKRMVERTELTTAYSLSTLELLEERQSGASSEPRLMLVADPVFSIDDPRMARMDEGAKTQRSAEKSDLAHLDVPRLPATGVEAESIAKLMPADRVRVAMGFDANARVFTELQKNDYSILHFATHLRVDRDDPGLTSLLLSRMDANGKSLRGSVAAYEIAAMKLHPELVVLSACDSSTGKDFRGEGMLGLGRAFLLSGAQSVIATQWPVADRATSELMQHLYAAMLQEGKSPAAALRAAQMKMMSDKRWQHPYFWAGFVVYGSPGFGSDGTSTRRATLARD